MNESHKPCGFHSISSETDCIVDQVQNNTTTQTLQQVLRLTSYMYVQRSTAELLNLEILHGSDILDWI